MTWTIVTIFLIFVIDPEFLGRRAAVLVRAFNEKLREQVKAK